MNGTAFEALLYRLCVDLGFCLPPGPASDLAAVPPIDARRATDAVFRAEGMDPELAAPHLYRQVHAIVSEAYYGEARSVELDFSAPDVVTIILDEEYGYHLASLDRGAIWIVDSPTNISAVEEVWGRDRPRQITTFRNAPGLAVWKALARILPDVELHHGVLSQDPPYRRVEVIGCRADHAVERTLADFGFELERTAADAFVARRSSGEDG